MSTEAFVVGLRWDAKVHGNATLESMDRSSNSTAGLQVVRLSRWLRWLDASNTRDIRAIATSVECIVEDNWSNLGRKA